MQAGHSIDEVQPIPLTIKGDIAITTIAGVPNIYAVTSAIDFQIAVEAFNFSKSKAQITAFHQQLSGTAQFTETVVTAKGVRACKLHRTVNNLGAHCIFDIATQINSQRCPCKDFDITRNFSTACPQRTRHVVLINQGSSLGRHNSSLAQSLIRLHANDTFMQRHAGIYRRTDKIIVKSNGKRTTAHFNQRSIAGNLAATTSKNIIACGVYRNIPGINSIGDADILRRCAFIREMHPHRIGADRIHIKFFIVTFNPPQLPVGLIETPITTTGAIGPGKIIGSISCHHPGIYVIAHHVHEG